MASGRPVLRLAIDGLPAPVRIELLVDSGAKAAVIASHAADLCMECIVDSAETLDGVAKFGRAPAPGGLAFPLLLGNTTTATVSVPRNAAGMPAPKSLPPVAAPNAATNAMLEQCAVNGARPFVACFDPKEPTGVFYVAGASPALSEAVATRCLPFGRVIGGADELENAIRAGGGLSILEAAVEPPVAVPRVCFKTSEGSFTLELFPSYAPIAVANLLDLVKSGFYDGVHVHRIVADFVAQLGCPISKDPKARQAGSGGPAGNTEFPGVTDADGPKHVRSSAGKIPDELTARVSNTKYTVSMANSGSPNTGGSQFFINLGNNAKLDWFNTQTASAHPVFGAVCDGFDVIDALSKAKVGANDRPANPIKIESATLVP